MDLLETPQQVLSLFKERFDIRILDFIGPHHLPIHEFAVGNNSDLIGPADQGFLQSVNQRRVLGHIIGRQPDGLGNLMNDGIILANNHADTGWPGITATGPVNIDQQPH